MPPRWGLKPIVRPSFSHGWLAMGHRMAPASRASDFLTPRVQPKRGGIGADNDAAPLGLKTDR
jgi:hypothetical protein